MQNRVMRRGAIRRSLPEIGRLFKGTPKVANANGKLITGKDYKSHYLRFQPDATMLNLPASSDEFQCMADELGDRWEAIIDRKIVDVRLPYPTIAENFSWSNETGREMPGGYRTLFRCDGQTMSLRTEFSKDAKGKNCMRQQAGAWPCAAGADGVCPNGCEPKGYLSVIIPDLYPAGIVVIPLNSVVDIENLQGQLAACEGADMRSIPFQLYRAPKSLTWQDSGGNAQVTPENWGLNLMISPAAMLAIMGSQERKLLSEGLIEVEAEAPAMLPAALPHFKNSNDGLAFQAAIQAAKAAGDYAAVHQAVETAQEVAGLYEPTSTQRFIKYEAGRALDTIRDMGSLPTAPAMVADVAEEFISESDRQRLFSEAKNSGHTLETMRLGLQQLGIEGRIPRDRFSEVSKLFNSPKRAKQLLSELTGVEQSVEPSVEVIEAEEVAF